MKKKFCVVSATAFLLAFSSLNISANATVFYLYPDWCNEFDFENHKANFVINGVYHKDDSTIPYQYSVTYLTNYTIGENGNRYQFSDSTGIIGVRDLAPYLENAENLKVGDLIYITEAFLCCAAAGPGYWEIANKSWSGFEELELEVNYIGNGAEIFGNQFMKAVRDEMLPYMEESYMSPWILSDDSRYETFDIVMGDATDDNEVDIIDVIAMNKAILGQKTMSFYAQYVSDVNKDNIVDPMDSLAVMKYIVGLTDTLGE
ncbi:MAG: hypothetical protein HDT22_02590 [Ruminococcus sp.]|nr:hypothetical protein [Ruminococcus sp.]